MTVYVPQWNAYWPPRSIFQNIVNSTAFNTTNWVIDATGEKFAFTGKHWNAARATKSIRKVGFLWGAVTKAGGSGLTLSLQDLDTATGNPIQPDGTQDQTVAIAAAGVTANTWYETGNLSADRSLAFGAGLAVVVEYDGGGRLGADSFAPSVATIDSGNFTDAQTAALLNTGSWAVLAVNRQPLVGFIYDDGSYGGFAGCSPLSGRGAVSTYNTGSSPDEYAMEFVAPYDCKCDGALVHVFATNVSSDFDVVLYDAADNVKGTYSVDAHQVSEVATYRPYFAFWTPADLVGGDTYRLAIKATAANPNNIGLPYVDFPSQAWKAASGFPQNFGLTSRTDAGAWAAATQTRVIAASIRLSEFTVGGVGGVATPLFGGGIVG